MKKTFSVMLLLAIGFILAGCWSSPSTSSTNTNLSSSSPSSASTNNSSEQRISYFNSIAEEGQRYMFQDNEGKLKPFIVTQYNGINGRIWILHQIQSTDRDYYIIDTWMIRSPSFDDYYYVPFFGGLTIRHVTNDIWHIQIGDNGEYVTMIKAPEGFWKEAYLDAKV